MSDLAADFALLSNATTFIASGATTSSGTSPMGGKYFLR
jgi:hypothetical protein